MRKTKVLAEKHSDTYSTTIPTWHGLELNTDHHGDSPTHDPLIHSTAFWHIVCICMQVTVSEKLTASVYYGTAVHKDREIIFFLNTGKILRKLLILTKEFAFDLGS
jgi:hypothetical protein